MEVVDPKIFVLPAFAVLILLELVYSIWRERPAYALKDFGGSMSQLAGNIVSQIATRGLILAFYYVLYQFSPWNIPTNVWGILALIIAIDFTYYWYHRASHRVRILWAVHVAHHSSQYMNLGTALRQSWFGPISKPIFYWPLPLIGFDPLALMAVGSALTVYGFWTHTEQIKRLGVFEYILVTPSHHRVHHGSNDLYIDKNYSNFLIIWDKLFGTFQAEEKHEPVRYGIRHNLNSFNPVKIALHEFVDIGKDLNRQPGRIIPILFKPPGS